MGYAKLRPRRGTASQWRDANTLLNEGELGIEVPETGVGTGKSKIKIGDGYTRWNDLPYAVDYAPSELIGDTIGYTAKNLIWNPPDEDVTVFGVTVHYNNDYSITFNGTATNTFGMSLNQDLARFVPNTVYKLSGCPEGGSESTYHIYYSEYDEAGNVSKSYDTGDGATFIYRGTGYPKPGIVINTGTVCDNLTFYPMLCRADIMDDSYEPYVPTVEQRLTELDGKLVTVESGKTTVNDNGLIGEKMYHKYSDGRLVQGMTLYTSNTPINNQTGALYSSSPIALPDFEVPFFEIPITHIQAHTNDENYGPLWVMSKNMPTATNAGSVQLARATSHGGVRVYIHVIAEGRWK